MTKLGKTSPLFKQQNSKNSLIQKPISMSTIVGNLLKGALFVFLMWCSYYFSMPILSFSFSDILGELFFFSLIGAVLFLPFRSMGGYRDTEPSKFIPTIAFGTVAIIAVLFLMVGGLASTATFREGWYKPDTNSFQSLLGKINDTCNITTDVSPIDPNHIVVMDEPNALRLAEKRLTEFDKSLGSQTQLGRPTRMKVDTKSGSMMVYVVPVEHSGFWKWWYNKTVPGYILVNAQNDKDVRMVTELNGKKLHMRYIPSGAFGDDLERHIYNSGYSNLGITDMTLEVDDDLNPWYVVTTYENTIGFSGDNATGCLVVDPVTGDIKQYSIANAPKWIDRIQPINFLETQVKWWGEYVHGCWANWSGKDQLMPTTGSTLVYGSDGVCYIYIGVTSVGADNASAGFFLINSRNKEARYYKMTGATEEAAMNSASEAVGQTNPNLKTVTQPLPYNIDGEFTYVMAHKGDEGLIKAISFVSYANYEIVGTGDNMRLALADYKTKLREKNIISSTKTKGNYDINGVVERISVMQENTYLTIVGLDKIFVAPNSLNSEVYLTKIGDKVKIEFENCTGKDVFLNTFDNLNIVSDTVSSQMENYFKHFNDSIKTDKYAKDFDAKYKNLSTEDKYKVKGVKTNTSKNPDEVVLPKKDKAKAMNEIYKK